MQVEELVLRVCGFDDDGVRVRVYFDEPTPLPLLGREHGVCSPVFRDLTPQEAGEFRRYLGRHQGWEYLRVQPAPALCAAPAGW
jgi:hypothetical protein